MLNTAIIGYGGIAKAAHVPAYKVLEEKRKARIIAACDIYPEQFPGKLEINAGTAADTLKTLHTYTDLDAMLVNEQIDMIDICLPTYLHSKYTIDMLERGYHVFCEKPMAITFGECEAMIKTTLAAKGKLMVGQCLRFSEEYLFLKKIIDSNEFGKPISAVFRRQSSPPPNSRDNWMLDYSRSGGCLLDLHIHDIDIARFLFGEPEAVSCVTGKIHTEDDIAHSRLIYKNLAVLAIGDWSQYGINFCADYRAGFEKATVICEGGIVTVYPHKGEPWRPPADSSNMYIKEIEYLIDVAANGTINTRNTPQSAALSVKLIAALKESAEKNGKIIEYTGS